VRGNKRISFAASAAPNFYPSLGADIARAVTRNPCVRDDEPLALTVPVNVELAAPLLCVVKTATSSARAAMSAALRQRVPGI
jgi:hypothetical protein